MASVYNFFKSFYEIIPSWTVHVFLFSVWIVLHVPAIYYGTSQLPFHSSYVGDEQSPVTGALQILQTKSLLALFNLESLYYGPLFAVIALPAVIVDFVSHALATGLWGVAEYKNHILYDWGGIIWKSRVIALMAGYLGLVALYKILTSKTVNPSRASFPVVIGVTLLATNFYYFEYSSFFKHWIFMLVPLMWQLYVLVLMHERPEHRRTYFVMQALLASAAFSITYLSLLSQVILLPLFARMVQTRGRAEVAGFMTYIAVLFPLCAITVAWNPMQVMRYLELFASNVLQVGHNEYTATVDRDPYALAYFTKVFVVNHLFIILSGAVLVVTYYKRIAPAVRGLLASCSLFGILYFVLAVAQSNHVSRYVLPTVIALVFFVAILFVHLYPTLNKKKKTILVGLLGITIVYHTISAVFWSHLMFAGPPERVAIFEILQYQSTFPNESVVIVGSTLFGWPHTTASYSEFALTHNMTDRPLFKAYERSVTPKSPLLSVSYVSSTKDMVELQSRRLRVECRNPQTGTDAEEGDYPEVLLFRLWTSDYYWQTSCDTNIQTPI